MQRNYTEKLKKEYGEGKLGTLVTKETPIRFMFSKYPSNKKGYNEDPSRQTPSKHHAFQMSLLFWNEDAFYITRKMLAFICLKRGLHDLMKKVVIGAKESEFTREELDFLYSISDIKTQLSLASKYKSKEQFMGDTSFGSGKFHTSNSIFEIYLKCVTEGTDEILVQLNATQNVFFKSDITSKQYNDGNHPDVINKFRPKTYTVSNGKKVPYEWGDDFFTAGSTVIAGIEFKAHQTNDGCYSNIQFVVMCNMVGAGSTVSDEQVDEALGEIDLSQVSSNVSSSVDDSDDVDGGSIQDAIDNTPF